MRKYKIKTFFQEEDYVIEDFLNSGKIIKVISINITGSGYNTTVTYIGEE